MIVVIRFFLIYRRETTVPDEFVASDSGSVADSLAVVFNGDGVGE
jgi:hypothetical protein